MHVTGQAKRSVRTIKNAGLSNIKDYSAFGWRCRWWYYANWMWLAHGHQDGEGTTAGLFGRQEQKCSPTSRWGKQTLRNTGAISWQAVMAAKGRTEYTAGADHVNSATKVNKKWPLRKRLPWGSFLFWRMEKQKYTHRVARWCGVHTNEEAGQWQTGHRHETMPTGGECWCGSISCCWIGER